MFATAAAFRGGNGARRTARVPSGERLRRRSEVHKTRRRHATCVQGAPASDRGRRRDLERCAARRRNGPRRVVGGVRRSAAQRARAADRHVESERRRGDGWISLGPRRRAPGPFPSVPNPLDQPDHFCGPPADSDGGGLIDDGIGLGSRAFDRNLHRIPAAVLRVVGGGCVGTAPQHGEGGRVGRSSERRGSREHPPDGASGAGGGLLRAARSGRAPAAFRRDRQRISGLARHHACPVPGGDRIRRGRCAGGDTARSDAGAGDQPRHRPRTVRARDRAAPRPACVDVLAGCITVERARSRRFRPACPLRSSSGGPTSPPRSVARRRPTRKSASRRRRSFRP